MMEPKKQLSHKHQNLRHYPKEYRPKFPKQNNNKNDSTTSFMAQFQKVFSASSSDTFT